MDIQALQKTLFSAAYRMIGEIAPSEDIAQDTIAIYLSKDLKDIQNVSAYLVKTAVNRSINYLNKVKKERENYFGVWLPEPVFNQQEAIDNRIDIDYGLTFLLSQLNPKERAVFILKNAFDFSYKEIEEAIDLKEASCRKTYQRLKGKLQKDVPQNNVTQDAKKNLVDAFLQVKDAGDINQLIDVLHEDIALYSDGGGKIAAAKNPLFGIEICAKFLYGVYQKGKGLVSFHPAIVNNEPAFLLKTPEGKIDTIVQIEVNEYKISRFYLLRNPEKIKSVTKSAFRLS